MIKPLLLIVFILTFFTNIAISQEKKKRPDIAISPGIIFQGQTCGEINVLIGRYESTTGGNGFGGLRLGVESNFRSHDENIFAPKIGVELSGMVICMRATLLSYINKDDVQLRILPEFGISYLGFANLTYGYNFKISRTNIQGIINHRVCLSFNFNRDLIIDAFTF